MNSKNLPEKPLILTIDDNEDINLLIQNWLKTTHCNIVTHTSPKKFLLQVKKLNPKLCIIDLNIGAPGIGFKIIEAIRKTLGKKSPIILLTVENDPAAIARGIELGADDYLIKPSTKKEIIEKVESYLDTTQIDEKNFKKGIPNEYKQLKIMIDVWIDEIDEFGIKVTGSELLTKGSAVLLQSDFFSKFLNNDRPIIGTVTNNWIKPNDQTNCALIEFDPSNESFLAQIRSWIISKKQEKKDSENETS